MEMLYEKSRDILDEVDAICNPKTSQVYTMGCQVEIDGGAHRWKVIQAVLRILQSHMSAIHEEYGSENVEYRPPTRAGFPHYRIFPDSPDAEDVLDDANQKVIESILAGEENIMPLLPTKLKEQVESFIFNNGETLEEISDELGDEGTLTALLLRGLLSYGILSKCLSMRHRVDYGVNPEGTRNMAVPFRARDVAAPNTEFGHADMALTLTHLSYYARGLR